VTPRWAGGLAVGALLAASALAVATAPDNDGVIAPFPVYGSMGEPVGSRTLTATVNSVQLTDSLIVKYRDDFPTIETDGVWVVVDATTAARLTTEGLSNLELHIGDVRYRVSDVLPPSTPLLLSYGAGVPQRGSFVFELPLAALDAPAAARASVVFLPRLDSSLDSVPVIGIDLTGLTVAPGIRIEEVAVVDNEG